MILYTRICHMLMTEKGYEWGKSFSRHYINFSPNAAFTTFLPFSSKPLKWELKIGLERMSLTCSLHECRHFLFLCLLFLTLLTDKCFPFLPSHWLWQGSSCCKPFYRRKIVESFPVVFLQYNSTVLAKESLLLVVVNLSISLLHLPEIF